MSDVTSFTLDKVTLYLQDALEGMLGLPDQSFDLAIADPPYGASTSASWKLETGHSLPSFGGAWKLASHSWDMLNGADGFEITLRWLS
jgi:site-specific DNA-methyltransferase (adenine-specific)